MSKPPASAARRRKRSGNQAGDPVRAAQAIIKAVEAKDAPLRLLLGKPALDLAYKKLETQKANFDAWAETTRGADFPDAQQKKLSDHALDGAPIR